MRGLHLAMAGAAMALLAGCSSGTVQPERQAESRATVTAGTSGGSSVTTTTTSSTAGPSGSTSASASATSTAGGASHVKESTGSYEFEYGWPAPAGRYPGLVRWLEADRARLKAQTVEGARADPDTIARGMKYSGAAEWKLVADTPRFLSLSEEGYSFTGGAHGLPFYGSLLWDKQVGRRVASLDLFLGKPALRKAIQVPFCAELDRQRAAKRGEKINRASGDEFDACIDPTRETLLLGSSTGRAFDRIGIIVAPYDAGPYAEGDYEVTLPVTRAVLDAIRPDYRSAFALR